MSQAVFDLNLEMPPVTITRVRMADNTVRWVARCAVCSHRSRPRPLLSAAMTDMTRHGRDHAAYMLHRAADRPTTIHQPQPLDAVHLTERQAS